MERIATPFWSRVCQKWTIFNASRTETNCRSPGDVIQAKSGHYQVNLSIPVTPWQPPVLCVKTVNPGMKIKGCLAAPAAPCSFFPAFFRPQTLLRPPWTFWTKRESDFLVFCLPSGPFFGGTYESQVERLQGETGNPYLGLETFLLTI